jgi:hypothetical protein
MKIVRGIVFTIVTAFLFLGLPLLRDTLKKAIIFSVAPFLRDFS